MAELRDVVDQDEPEERVGGGQGHDCRYVAFLLVVVIRAASTVSRFLFRELLLRITQGFEPWPRSTRYV